MQHIVIQTANSEPLLHEDGWAFNGIGRKFSHKVSVFQKAFFKYQNPATNLTCFKKSCMFFPFKEHAVKLQTVAHLDQQHLQQMENVIFVVIFHIRPLLELLAWSTIHNSMVFIIKKTALVHKTSIEKSFQNMNHV